MQYLLLLPLGLDCPGYALLRKDTIPELLPLGVLELTFLEDVEKDEETSDDDAEEADVPYKGEAEHLGVAVLHPQ